MYTAECWLRGSSSAPFDFNGNRGSTPCRVRPIRGLHSKEKPTALHFGAWGN